MAEKKLYGQALDDAIKGGVRSLYENENAQAFGRGLINNPLSKGITNYIIDPIAELGTRAASAKGIFPFLPDTSILTALTPEVTADRETRESIDADITQYPTMGERLEKRMDRFRADVGAFGEFLFGDVRNAGENLNAGVKFADLPPEQKMASRFFLLDIIPLPGVGPAAKAGAKATRELENLKSRMVTSDGSVGAAASSDLITDQIRNTVGPVSDEELQYLSTAFFNFPAEQRGIVHGLLDEVEKEKFAGFLKEKATPEMFPGRVKIENGIKYFRNDGSGGNQTFLPEDQIYINILGSEGNKGIVKFNRATEGPPLLKNLKLQMSKKLEDVDTNDVNAVHNIFRETYLNATGRTIDNTPGGKATGTHLLGTIKKYNATNPEIKIPSALDAKMYRGSKNVPKDVKFADYYEQNITDKTQGKVTLKNEDPEYRFFFNLNRTTPDLKAPQEFFSNYKLEDVRPGGKLHDKFLQFEAIDKIRLQGANDLKPVLQKIFKQVREDSLKDFPVKRDVDTRTSLNLAHKFETQGIASKYVSPDKYGTGADPSQLYIDISEYNSVIQRGYEEEARKLYARYADKGDEIDFQKLQDIDKEMRILGIQGEIAPGQSIGKAMPIDQKISEIMIEAMDKGYVTQTDVNKAITAVNKIAKTKKQNAKLFEGSDIIEKAQGGVVTQSFEDGGIVNAADVQYAAPGGFFSKMFGKPPAYMKEEIAKTDIFSPTTKQQATLKALGPEATAINPGQVFYSNIELSLSKPNSPVKFDSEKEFYDYINAAGIGRDEVGDARIGPYISAKAKSGEPILSQDIIQITSESPLNQLTTDGYGFRSDKINIAKRDQPERYDSPAITKGQAVYREPKYSGTGLMPGYLPGTYRERVLQIDSDKFRGDPGTLPSASAQSHSFGDNYTIAWGRATDRPAIVNEGEMVDKATGTIINPLALTDTKKLQDIEAKIQTLIDDPLTKVDPDDFQTISQAVEALVQKSGGRLTYDKAKQAVDAQIVQKQKQLRKLQSQFVDEEKRLESISTMKPQNITMTFIDEIQSDIAQSATRKSKELAAKLDVMAEQGISFEAMQEGIDRDVLQFFAENKSVARPVGATKLELMPQYEELMAFQKQFSDMAKKPPYALGPQDFAMYENFKKRQGEIIDSMADEINDQLMKALYPDVPLKDRGSWSDAVLKQHLYEAAHRLFVEKDPSAPTHLGVASGDIVAGKAYNQNGSTATDIAERTADKQRRLDNYKDALRANINTTQAIGNSNLPGVGTHEFYGGPLSRAWDEEAGKVGGHYTSDIERSMRKYAEDNNSKLIIANVAVSDARGGTVYNIINQETAEIMGQGDTYRQAENIANQLVDEDGGRYKIQKSKEKNFETEPVFSIPLTKEMLQLNKIYK